MNLHSREVLIFAAFIFCNIPESRADVNPKMIMGFESGEIKQCKFYATNDCTTLSVQESPVNALVTAGEFIYVGLKSGELRRCSQFRASNCTTFHQFDSEINALAVSRNKTYISTNDGITQCGLRKSEDCISFYKSDTPIYSLVTYGEYLFAGKDFSVLNCSTLTGDCKMLLYNVTSAVNALTVSNGKIYLGLKEGTVEVCRINHNEDEENCQPRMLFKTQSEIKDLDIFDNNVQASLDSGEIMRFDLDSNKTTTISLNVSGPVLSFTSVFDTTCVKKDYVGESKSCVWQWQACPPFIVYYDVQSRAALELHFKDGKVYNAEGDLFDTDGSDFGHSGSKAIFVMDSSGRIFASNTHPVGLLHHSSLMGGKPAAAAGEIKVNEGIITSISSCSGHYRPKIAFVNQVHSSIKRQGYDRNVTVINCFGSELLIDLDYKKTDLYYKVMYERYSLKMKTLNMNN